MSDKKKIEDHPAVGLSPKNRAELVFATDRDDEKTSDIDTRFGTFRLSDWGPSCGTVPAPDSGIVSGAPPANHLVITRGIESCADLIGEALGRAESSRVMFFIHGYKNTFLDAVRSGLGLSNELNYDGVIVVWSWPSDGRAPDYPFDEESAEWSRQHLAALVEAVISRFQKIQTDYFAHSMGNRILLHVLNDGALIKNNGSIIFAAPDVAQDIFSDAFHKFQSVGKIKELYASNSDWALWASGILNSPHDHHIARAGEGGENILVLQGLETVDATRLSSIWSSYGHSYVFENSRATHDIDQILNLGRRADERGLERREKNGATFWMFGP